MVRCRRVWTRLLAAAMWAPLLAAAELPVTLALPKPDTEGGKPLMQVLKARHSSREFSREPLPLPVLSSLLWAAAGVNRPESGKRTAPSARDWQEVDVYVTLADGLYLYDSKAHVLRRVAAGDLRALTGRQEFVKDAPVNLVYVADFARTDPAASDTDRQLYSAAGAGFISQNVYLYCASQGLATVVRGWVDREPLARAMQLKPSQRIILAQTVGLPAK